MPAPTKAAQILTESPATSQRFGWGLPDLTRVKSDITCPDLCLAGWRYSPCLRHRGGRRCADHAKPATEILRSGLGMRLYTADLCREPCGGWRHRHLTSGDQTIGFDLNSQINRQLGKGRIGAKGKTVGHGAGQRRDGVGLLQQRKGQQKRRG